METSRPGVLVRSPDLLAKGDWSNDSCQNWHKPDQTKI